MALDVDLAFIDRDLQRRRGRCRRLGRERNGRRHCDPDEREGRDRDACEGQHAAHPSISRPSWRPSPGRPAGRGILAALTLFSLRRSAIALLLSVFGWAAGCAITPHPMVDPGYAARAYTPMRVAVLPPDVFVVVDQVGDNDPAQSAALGQQVSGEIARAAEQSLRAHGYDVDLSARWDGIFGQDGSVLVSREQHRTVLAEDAVPAGRQID